MGLRYQSVELVRRYLYAKIGFNVALFWSDGDAIDWWKAHRFMGLTQIDVDKLQPGDILVWRGGKFGHLSILSEMESHRIKAVSQNIHNNELDLGMWVDKTDREFSFHAPDNSSYVLIGGLRYK